MDEIKLCFTIENGADLLFLPCAVFFNMISRRIRRSFNSCNSLAADRRATGTKYGYYVAPLCKPSRKQIDNKFDSPIFRRGDRNHDRGDYGYFHKRVSISDL